MIIRIKMILCMLTISSFMLLCAFDSEEQKVYDFAGLFSSDEITELERIAVEYANDVELDFVIVSTNDKEGKTAKQYAEEFYDEKGFGYEYKFGSCVIFLIDMEDRNAYIATQGIAIQYIDDYDIEYILDDIFVYLPDADYYNSAKSFLESTRQYAEEYLSDSANSDKIQHWKTEGYTDYSQYYDDHYESSGKYYDDQYESSGKYYSKDNFFTNFKNPFISLMIALVIAIIFVILVRFKAKTKMVASGSTYIDKGNFNVNEKQDLFIGTTTIRRKIPKNTGGKGGGSGGSFSIGSGGRSHGGGGRSF